MRRVLTSDRQPALRRFSQHGHFTLVESLIGQDDPVEGHASGGAAPDEDAVFVEISCDVEG